MAIDRAAQCRQWNADHAHQRLAGQMRAKGFTQAHQSHAGTCSFLALSARMRASHGSPQLFPQAAVKYVAPADIRWMGGTLPTVLQEVIHAAWGAGQGWGIDYWLLPLGVAPSLPAGTLFGVPDGHLWRGFAPGWLVCTDCWRAAVCPCCHPAWWDEKALARLPHALCAAHGGQVVG